jgi:hypothetical protein
LMVVSASPSTTAIASTDTAPQPSADSNASYFFRSK